MTPTDPTGARVPTLHEALTAALAQAFHEARWCKWSEPGHAVAHDDADEDGYRATLTTAILAHPDLAALSARLEALEALEAEYVGLVKSLWSLADRWRNDERRTQDLVSRGHEDEGTHYRDGESCAVELDDLTRAALEGGTR